MERNKYHKNDLSKPKRLLNRINFYYENKKRKLSSSQKNKLVLISHFVKNWRDEGIKEGTRKLQEVLTLLTEDKDNNKNLVLINSNHA